MSATAPLSSRAAAHTFDALDVTIAEAMLLAALGPTADMAVSRTPAGDVTISLTAAGAAAIEQMAGSPDPVSAQWAELASVGLVEAVVDQVGSCWRAEAELGVDLALALRAEEAVAFAHAAVQAPVTVPAGPSAAALIAADVPSPGYVFIL